MPVTSHGTNLADEGAKEPVRELAAEIANLGARDPELHASSVHMHAEELKQLSRDGRDLFRVIAEAKGVEEIAPNLRVANRLDLATRH